MRRFAPLFAFMLTAAIASAQAPQSILDPTTIPQFESALPTLSVLPQSGTMLTLAGSRPLTLRMCEFKARVLPTGAVDGYTGTWVWGYLADPTGDSTCAQLIARYGAGGVLDTYIGPVIVNERGKPTQVTYVNDLGSASTTNVRAFKDSTDQTLHWADPEGLVECSMAEIPPAAFSRCSQNYAGSIPAVAHLHGGEVPAEIDGSPESWVTSDGLTKGRKAYRGSSSGNRMTFRYPNAQEAAPLWFHDHALGITRLNVYAGLAGAYLLHDPALRLPANLQPLGEVIPLVIQDRMFDEDGQLFYQAGYAGGELWALNPEHPFWSPEFIGDTIVVNGKAWPHLEVEPRRYRFLVLNGSNARTYELFFDGPSQAATPAMWVIGNDGGYLDNAVSVGGRGRSSRRRAAEPRNDRQSLAVMPGERYEVIVDFGALPPGTRLHLRNTAGTPYPFGDPVDPATTGRVLEVRVRPCTSGRCGIQDTSFDPAATQQLRSGAQRIVRLAENGRIAPSVTPALTRQLTLNEVMGEEQVAIDPITGELTEYPGGPLEVLLNNSEFNGESDRAYGDFTTISVGGTVTRFSEVLREGATEVWEIVNLTADAHPIHLHLAQFQLMNRQSFRLDDYIADYEASFPGGAYLQGFGPPYDYRASVNTHSGGKAGGNPDVDPYLIGTAKAAAAYESGWKDTVIVPPGEVTRLVVRWAPTDLPVSAPTSELHYPFDPTGKEGAFNYVWHCHILDHEDNEMMRPATVLANPLAPSVRRYRQGIDY